jgi:hypothetical protein
MANKTCNPYTRSKVGCRKASKRLADLPENETFVLFRYEGKAKKAKTVGRFADKAQTALINKKAALKRAPGADTANVPTPEPGKPTLTGRDFFLVVSIYLSEVKRGKSKNTHIAYSLTLKMLSQVCTALTIEAMTREDVLKSQTSTGTPS